jgi:hypothetical protein
MKLNLGYNCRSLLEASRLKFILAELVIKREIMALNFDIIVIVL